MFVTKSLALFALALSASALSTPHMARDFHHRRAAVNAMVAERAAAEPQVHPVVTPAKRNLRKRCAASSAPALSSTAVVSSSYAVPTSSDVPSSFAAPSSSYVAPSSSEVPSSYVAPSSSAAPSTYVAPSSYAAPSSYVAPSSSEAPSSVVIPTDVPSAPISVSSAPIYTPIPTSSPAFIATSSPEPTPTPIPTPTPSPSPSPVTSSAAPASTGSSSGSDGLGWPFATGATYTGDGTWYETGLGACGITNTDSDYIIAVSELLFDSYPGYDGTNPNNNPVCNKQILASYGGNSVTVTVTDRCTGCSELSLDFAPSAFEQLAPQSVGRLTGMTWIWI